MPAMHSCHRRVLSAVSRVLSDKCWSISAIFRAPAIIARLLRSRGQQPPSHPTRLRPALDLVLDGLVLQPGPVPTRTYWVLRSGQMITPHDFAAAASM